jgi:phosphatidylinositol alpha-1,6-mannosyltransferase
VERIREQVLLPHPLMVKRINEMAKRIGADYVVLDPAVPLGIVGPTLQLPYAVVLHGAEVTVPGRLPGSKQVLARVLRNASHVVAAGQYPADEAVRAAGRALPTTVVHPGVDTDRFRVLTPDERTAARVAFGVAPDAELIVGVSRLVPRKGFDTAIAAVARMARHRPRLEMVIVGAGRDADRLNKLARSMGAPVRFLGRVDVEDLPRIYGCADIFTMLCRNRWGGLEQEGFGIVFLEAAACGIPQVAGNSGGAAEAVEHNVTGLVVRDPSNVDHVVRAFTELLDNPELRADMGRSARKRAVEQFSYEVLAAKLWNTLRTLP